MNYDDNGNLVLSGKLGEAVVSGDFKAFTDALVSGKSQDGLSYQDMEDFNRFTNEFFRLGEYPTRDGDTYLVVLRKADSASFGTDKGDPSYPYEPSFEGDDVGFVWEFIPMNRYEGYEPAE